MPYAFTQDVPIDAAMYARITDGLGADPPPGLIVHIAAERPEGGLRYYSVWETQEACDRFSEERLHPVVHGLLEEIFGDQPPPEPARADLSVIHVWGAIARRAPTPRNTVGLRDSARRRTRSASHPSSPRRDVARPLERQPP